MYLLFPVRSIRKKITAVFTAFVLASFLLISLVIAATGSETVASTSPAVDLFPPLQADNTINFESEDALFGGSDDVGTDAAWGDVDGDGDLDLAVVGSGPNQLYLNENGRLQPDSVWTDSLTKTAVLTESIVSTSVAWGDMDGDGDLDLVVGNHGYCVGEPFLIEGEPFLPDFNVIECGYPNHIYLNNNGRLSTVPDWTSAEAELTYALAIGDVNGDGRLDLVVANEGVNRIYANRGIVAGQLKLDTVWESPHNESSRGIALGDMDGDGLLDLVVGNGPTCVEKDSENLSCLREEGGRNRVYFNTANQYTETNVWESNDFDGVGAIALADLDGNGWLDIFAGGSQNKIYFNFSDGLSRSAGWVDEGEYLAADLAIGDADNDGDLDVVVSDATYGIAFLLVNDGAWSSSVTTQEFRIGAHIRATAWGDMNGDGYLDLAAVKDKQIGSHRVFVNQQLTLQRNSWPLLQRREIAKSISLADVNRDGALDVGLVNNNNTVSVSMAESGVLTATAVWSTILPNPAYSIAWGDMNGDGYPDLAVAAGPECLQEDGFREGCPNSVGGKNFVYLNIDGVLQTNPAWVSDDAEETHSLAWGDVDGDGDLDLAAGSAPFCATLLQAIQGNCKGGANRVYLNDGHLLHSSADWVSAQQESTNSVVWGDVDGDGDLDLAAGNIEGSNHLYLNVGGELMTETVWVSQDNDFTASLAWGDVNGDGRLDLAAGNWSQVNKVYLNENGRLQSRAGWISRDASLTKSIAWADYDNDGDLDLTAGNRLEFGIYPNDNGQLATEYTWRGSGSNQDQSMAWADFDKDGDLDLFTGATLFRNLQNNSDTALNNSPAIFINQVNLGATTNSYGSAVVISQTVMPISYTLTDIESDFVGRIGAFYSLDGGGTWRTAVPTTRTQTTNLPTAPNGADHVFYWDTFASGLLGKSDNAVLQLRAFDQPPPQLTTLVTNTYRYTNSIHSLYQRPFVAAATRPFRIQGTQIQVIDEQGDPVEGAFVYRLPQGQFVDANPIPSFDFPLETGADGLLPGVGTLAKGDKLVALWPVPEAPDLAFTDRARLFYTSAEPARDGLEMTELTGSGIIQLTVSPANPLILFDLIVSLEWDASGDSEFMQALRSGFENASELLYDVSNGQVTLGNIHTYHRRLGPDSGGWNTADIQILADNRLRPSAAYGGIVTRPLSETVRTINGTKLIPNAYVPQGKIRMGPVWDPFGENTSDLSEDWWRALAHELAHYALFLPDNYLGFKGADQNALGRINCQRSFMTSTYDPSYSEFLNRRQWLNDPDCQASLAERTTGRSDWETVRAFYPMLNAPGSEAPFEGPNILPLNVMNLISYVPVDGRSALPTRNFDVRNAANERWRLPNAQAYLIQTQGTDEPSDDLLVPLGSPTGGGDRLKVRGAFPSDKLCLIDSSNDQIFAGCIEDLQASNVAINVASPPEDAPKWEPEISVQVIASKTIQITVDQELAEGDVLQAQVFPAHYYSIPCFTGLAPVVTLDENHQATIDLRLAAFDVSIHVWVDKDWSRQSVNQFILTLPQDTSQSTKSAAQTTNTTNCNPGTNQLKDIFPVLVGGPNTGPTGGPNTGPTGGPNTGPTGGPNTGPTGGPNTGPTGGPNTGPTGGPNTGPTGGPNTGPTGGPNTGPTGGPNTGPTGGSDHRIFSAPIWSADAQVVIYSQDGFFEDNGVATLQVLASIPGLEKQPWLTPVGQPYHVTLADKTAQRSLAYTYLQRDIPEGYEHTARIYFRPDSSGEDAKWIPLPTQQFVENLVVAELRNEDGAYAVMSTIEMPAFRPGWNAFVYPLPFSRPITTALASINSANPIVFNPEQANNFEDLAIAFLQATVIDTNEFATALVNLNIRTGPGVSNRIVSSLRRGESAVILAKDESTGWLQIQCQPWLTNVEQCWVSGSARYVQAEMPEGNTTAVNFDKILQDTTTNVDNFEFGKIYWIKIDGNNPVRLYLAPPVRLPDGSLK